MTSRIQTRRTVDMSRPMSHHRLHLALASAAVVLGSLAVSALPAAGAGTPGPSVPTGAPAASGAPTTCSPSTLSALVGYVQAELTARTAQLSSLTAAVGADTTLTPGDRASLNADLANDTGGIATLTGQLPSLTTCRGAIISRHSMVAGYRV